MKNQLVGVVCSSDNECASQSAAACSGRCQNGVCAFPGTETLCADDAKIEAGGYRNASTCDGAGACVAGALDATCGAECGRVLSCTSNAQCSGNQICMEGKCACGGVVGFGGAGGCSTTASGFSADLFLPFALVALWFAIRARRVLSFKWARSAAKAAVVAIAVAGAAQSASAANTFELQRFQPLFGTRDILNIQSALTPGHLKFSAGILGHYAHNPLVVQYHYDGGGGYDDPIVKYQAELDIGGSIGIGEWFELGITIPLQLASNGAAQTTFTLPEPGDFALSAIRLSPKVRIFNSNSFGLGIALPFSIPVGGGDYAEDKTIAINPKFLIDYSGPVRLSANVGYLFRDASKFGFGAGGSSSYLLTVGQAFNYGLGAEFPLTEGATHLDLLASIYGETGLEQSRKQENPLEALGALRLAMANGLSLTGGAGVGLIGGYGSPDFRVLAGVGYASPLAAAAPVVAPIPEPMPVLAAVEPEPQPVAPPPPPVELKANELSIEVKQGYSALVHPLPQVTGAPQEELSLVLVTAGMLGQTVALDKGVVRYSATSGQSGADEFNYVVADKAGNRATGVVRVKILAPPKDTDRDGIPDDKDQCPAQPETYNNYKDDDGCPDKAPRGTKKGEKAIIIGEKIVITEQVFFANNKDTILKKSFPLLDSVAKLIRATPSIKKVRIEGHTDDKGNDEKNLDLSERRARKVREYLVSWGIEQQRLVSAGYGEAVPVASNKTSAGRALNRRVEFNVLERDLTVSDEAPVETKSSAVSAAAQVNPQVQTVGAQVIVRDPIRFTGKTNRLAASSKSVLDSVASYLATQPSIKRMQIEVHTEGRGNARNNLRLSEKRAEAVRRYLVDGGVEATRLLPMGLGDTMPIDSPKTAKGRAANQRVLFRIIDGQ